MQAELSKYDYDVMVVYDGEKQNGLSTFERMIKIGKVDGFIIFRMESSKKDLELIKKYKVPCVYLLHAEKAGSYGSCLSDLSLIHISARLARSFCASSIWRCRKSWRRPP